VLLVHFYFSLSIFSIFGFASSHFKRVCVTKQNHNRLTPLQRNNFWLFLILFLCYKPTLAIAYFYATPVFAMITVQTIDGVSKNLDKAN